MGLFDFIGNIGSAVVKVAITPIAVIKDMAEQDPEMTTTSKTLSSAVEDVNEAFDELLED